MVEETLGQNDKGKSEEKKPLLRKEEPFRIEPKEVKPVLPVLKDIPLVITPKKPVEVSPKETREKKEEETIILPKLDKAKIGTSSKTEGKSCPCFRFLFILSLAFMALALGLLLLPLLNISLPPFLANLIAAPK